MGGYRDDREALRARITSLEALLKDAPTSEGVLAELAVLREQVSQTLKEISSDRDEVAALIERLDGLTHKVEARGKPKAPRHDGATSTSSTTTSTTSAPEERGSSGTALAWLGALGLVGVVTALLIANAGESPAAPSFDEPAVLAAEAFDLFNHGPELLESPAAIPGGLEEADPMAVLELARDAAPDGAEIASVSLDYVGTNGRLNLSHDAYNAGATYAFFVPMADVPPVPEVPPGAPEPPPPAQGRRTSYRLDATGLHNDFLVRMTGEASTTTDGRFVPPPSCSIEELWVLAFERGAPDGSVARLHYGPHESGDSARAVWSFTVEGNVRMTVDDPGCVAREPAPDLGPAAPE